jgi:1-deoxy-D-xylulose-5-phosphate synthase
MLTNTTIFEDLGLDYIGPVDGHNLDQVCSAIQSAKLTQRPALVHVRTVKGKGFDCAEQSPERFHGIGCFDPETGDAPASSGSFTDIFAEELCAFAAADTAVCAVTAAMALGTGLSRFAAAYPGRFFDVGIAESHAVTFAAGLAKQGMRPVVALYSSFLQRGFDQLLHDAALQELPLVVAVDRAGFVGADGATHHGLYDVAFCAAIPGARVVAPTTGAELREMLHAALREPVLTFLRYPRTCAMQTTAEPRRLHSCEICDIYGDANADIAVVTYGRLFCEACRLPGIKIVKLKQLQPLEPIAAEAVLACQRVCFFEEGIRTGGAGERFGLLLLERRYAGVFSLHAVEGFARHAPVDELLAECGLDAAGMAAVIGGAQL